MDYLQSGAALRYRWWQFGEHWCYIGNYLADETLQMELQDFLNRNNISQEDWDLAEISWEELQDIHNDFEARRSQLEDAAEFVVKSIQAFEGVHSVRWRVKDAEHLLEKIVRKRSEKNPSKKYMDINAKNYLKVVTDLIGVRALHLFKDEVFDIHERIRSNWGLNEKPVSYIREGDHSDLVERFKVNGITPKIHRSGYRSVHYILKMKPSLEQILIEVQVRTIFEEGWSEIDHKIRYPNFSDNKQLESILKIFNRLAGSADEMGSFIRGLSLEIDSFEERLMVAAFERDQAELEKNEALVDAQAMLDELDTMYGVNGESSEKIKALQSELKKLREKISASEVAKSDYRKVKSLGVKEMFINSILASTDARGAASRAINSMIESEKDE